MEPYHGFENWLKANEYVSWKSYISFMRQIEKTLLVKNLEGITSTTVLKKLMIDLQNNRAFMARTASDKSNILSGFRTYIIYIEEKNKH
jgi:hypothetical protein